MPIPLPCDHKSTTCTEAVLFTSRYISNSNTQVIHLTKRCQCPTAITKWCTTRDLIKELHTACQGTTFFFLTPWCKVEVFPKVSEFNRQVCRKVICRRPILWTTPFSSPECLICGCLQLGSLSSQLIRCNLVSKCNTVLHTKVVITQGPQDQAQITNRTTKIKTSTCNDPESVSSSEKFTMFTLKTSW